jgi:hypothetical protein
VARRVRPVRSRDAAAGGGGMSLPGDGIVIYERGAP